MVPGIALFVAVYFSFAFPLQKVCFLRYFALDDSLVVKRLKDSSVGRNHAFLLALYPAGDGY